MPPTSRSAFRPSRRASRPNRFAFRPVPAGLALAFWAAGAAANPQGGVVQAGSATIASSGSRLDVIQSSQRAVIDWRSFSIGAGGHVNFQQPSAAGATLNRVTGSEMSAILGRLSANGTVFIVNPNGILIGPGAKIDVGGLVAATANISNENFMAGRYKFDEVVNRDAVIINRGEITARAGGLVALVAPRRGELGRDPRRARPRRARLRKPFHARSLRRQARDVRGRRQGRRATHRRRRPAAQGVRESDRHDRGRRRQHPHRGLGGESRARQRDQYERGRARDELRAARRRDRPARRRRGRGARRGHARRLRHWRLRPATRSRSTTTLSPTTARSR